MNDDPKNLAVWGADPGTANMAAVLEIGAVPMLIIDIGSKAATKGKVATANMPAEPGKPDRFLVRVWALRRQVPGEVYDLIEEREIPESETTTEEIFNDFLTRVVAKPSEPQEACVERMVGNLAPDVIDQAGILVGLLWAWTGKQPKRVTSQAWRKRMLDLPGGCTAKVAEAEAVRRVREEVPGWPVEASGHAAEAYWIARWAAEVSG